MKKILLSLFISVLLIMGIVGVVAADTPTTVDIDWDGAGSVNGTVVAGDDSFATFHSEGNYHTGLFHAVDENDNPYTYNVDTCLYTMETAIDGTGWADFQVDRTDAKTSYGVAGQQSYSYVGVANGSATLQNRSKTNYASMRDCNYGWNANDHITVTGATSYTIHRYMDSDSTISGGNFASIFVYGSGNADLDCMNAEASAGQVKLGSGCGCYTNAEFSANGTGTMQLDGVGNNSATTALAPGMTGATSFSFIADWVGGSFNVADYSTTVN